MKDGTIYICGNTREIKEALDAYFERGYMLVPGSGSDVHGGHMTFCTVELPADFPERLREREEWLKDLSVQEAARQKLIYARRKAAA